MKDKRQYLSYYTYIPEDVWHGLYKRLSIRRVTVHRDASSLRLDGNIQMSWPSPFGPQVRKTGRNARASEHDPTFRTTPLVRKNLTRTAFTTCQEQPTAHGNRCYEVAEFVAVFKNLKKSRQSNYHFMNEKIWFIFCKRNYSIIKVGYGIFELQ